MEPGDAFKMRLEEDPLVDLRSGGRRGGVNPSSLSAVERRENAKEQRERERGERDETRRTVCAPRLVSTRLGTKRKRFLVRSH